MSQEKQGEDSTTTEWFGQSVESDTELAEEVAEKHDDPAEAEAEYDRRSKGEDVEASRRGDSIDPELGEGAYHDDAPKHAADS
ncbi:hypothetical protein [Ilumatobacter sp.]|uniref:hypothetical protein n=1 Tax=Ilumatobacter sp. TaxID=1967498 RepID=UPI003B522F10